MAQGPLRFTDSGINAAINGAGFFVVDTPVGERYTRDGRFGVDGEGYLVNPEGYRVLGENGPIVIAGSNASIGVDGVITSADIPLDRLRVVDFADPSQLSKEGGNLYSTGDAGMPQAITADLSPAYVEDSNVNVVAEMAELISATRYYEANQKVIQAEDDTLAKAVTEVGRVS
jgi:flagellar basal-body rod protein FlgG